MKKRKLKYRRFSFKDPVLGFQWNVQLGGEELAAHIWYTKKYKLTAAQDQDWNANAGSFSCSEKAPFTGLIWLGKPWGGSLLAHEVAHAVVHVCNTLELDPRQADEFQASYTGYLYRKILDFHYCKK